MKISSNTGLSDEKQLRVLVVEDNPHDAELIMRALRRGGYEPAWERVETEAAYVAHLKPELDLVLSDFALPEFNGLRALALLKDREPDVPFILVSATIGEEAAVAAMQQGAADYLMKDRLERLGQAVARALELAQLRRAGRQAEVAHRESADFVRDILNSLSAHVVVLDEQGVIIQMNEGWRRFARENGAAETDFIGRNYLAACEVPEDARDAVGADEAAAGIRAVLAAKCAEFALEYPCERPNGRRWFRMHVSPLSGSRRGVVVAHQDISERKRTELELQWKTALLEAQVSSSIDGILVVDPQGCKALQNARVTELFKIPAHVADDTEDRPQLEWVIKAVKHPEAFVQRVTYLLAHPDETARDEIELRDGTMLDRYSAPVKGRAGEYFGRIWTFRDITAAKAVERALRESEERFRGLIENGTDLIAVVDAEGSIHYQSPSAKRLLGYSPEEVQGRKVTDFIHPTDVGIAKAGMARALAEGPLKSVEYRIRHRDGRWRFFQSMGRLMPGHRGEKLVVVNSRDVTEMREVEAQFLRAQRMEAIGTLSSGIAHNLNNILAPMLMAAAILRGKMVDARSAELLALIEGCAQRGAGIIRKLLTYSRGIEGERVSVQCRDVLREMAAIAAETFPRNITITEKVAADLRPVLGDATQLHQVLMNLCVNARDAMPEGGTLVLAAENVELAEVAPSIYPDARPGAYVRITVTDSGSGISPEIMDKIFDPFFTTKEIDKGTGLGLATVQGIVKSHGGFIGVQSAATEGTRFIIHLPAEAEATTKVTVVAEQPAQRGRQELVLLVDDEVAIRRVATVVLERWNYRVESVPSGEAALTLLQEAKADFSLVVTDLMMPGMGGMGLITKLRALYPNLRIIAASGLDPGEKRAELCALGVTTILIKPYSPQSLLEAVATEIGDT